MGAPALANPAAVTVSNAAVQIVAANPKRRGLIITQTTANPVRYGNASVTAVTGARLAQNESKTFGFTERGDCPTEAIFAIREGGVDGSVCVLEFADT